MYINDELNLIKKTFNSFCSICNFDYRPKKITTTTFIKTPEWLCLKRSVLNPNNNDNKCFQDSITLSSYHEQIGKIFCRISSIIPFINNFKINFPPQEQDYQQFKMNNKSIALNILQFNDD